MQEPSPIDSGSHPVISPFSDVASPIFQKKKRSRLGLWLSLGVVTVLILAAGAFFLVGYLNDPLRTLEAFPVAKYLESYKALAGSKFRGDLRVENDLGWKEGAGRLMVFSMEDDPRPIVVMIPPGLAHIYFTKGQAYQGELEVKEGGLIYANTIRKN